jgi:hypothetical protein
MSYAHAGGAAAHAYQVIANAVKASGVIVHVTPEDFLSLLSRVEKPLVVVAAVKGLFGTGHTAYLASHKGLAFYAKSKTPLHLPGSAEVVQAKKIWIPEMWGT